MAQRTYNIYKAKTAFSKIVQRVEKGEEILIARNGKPVIKLIALEPRRKPRKPGASKGQIWIADDFDAPLPDELLRAFNGEND